MHERKELLELIEKQLTNVRHDLIDNPYLKEAIRVLPVQGYRSAIGCIWNAVVDDLRNKVIHRSLELFNRSLSLGHKVNKYEDFQNYVNDDQLIEGSYKTGIISWEASKVLKHAKETRHLFDGHPRSSEPSVIKVLGMLEDCIKYVLSEPYPVKIINIDEYITTLGKQEFDRNSHAIEQALGDLPEVYKDELVHRLFTVYIRKDAPTITRSNIEFVLPILWNVLPKKVKQNVVRRIDTIMPKGESSITDNAFVFVLKTGSQQYLSLPAKKYKIEPLIKKIGENIDCFDIENDCVHELLPFSGVIPDELIERFVTSLTRIYIGFIGGSARFSRTDFYANGAAIDIPKIFSMFDEKHVSAFVVAVKTDRIILTRLKASPVKVQRLRSLGNILIDRISHTFDNKSFIDLLCDSHREGEFLDSLPRI